MNSWPSGVDLADVAGVEPAVLERARGLLGGVEVAGRDVLAANENLAVGAIFTSTPAIGFADRSASWCRTDGSA